jgi:hypothetical protein
VLNHVPGDQNSSDVELSTTAKVEHERVTYYCDPKVIALITAMNE